MTLISMPGGSESDAGAITPASDNGEEFARSVYAHHATPLLRYAARLLNGDWHNAEDLVQEATVRAWKHFGTSGLDPLSIRPWMFTVMRNLAIDHHRARAVRPQETPSMDDVCLTVNDAIERVLTTQVVLDALNQLEPAHRDVIRLMHYRAYTVVQAAETLGVRPGTVKSRSHYALRALRTILQSRGVLHP